LFIVALSYERVQARETWLDFERAARLSSTEAKQQRLKLSVPECSMSVNSRTFVLAFSLVLSVSVIGPSSVGQALAGPTISFSMDVQPIFDARCAGCHFKGGFLDLTAGNSYAELVNVPTTPDCQNQVPDSVRVVAFDTQGSMLWLKTKPDDGRCGDPMPFKTEGLGVIAPEEFAIIEQWILEGALDN
jgi:hypothetical protein